MAGVATIQPDLMNDPHANSSSTNINSSDAASDSEHANTQSHNEVADGFAPHSQSLTKQDPHKAKWKRLSKIYSDQYLDLFTKSQLLVENDEFLEASQLGAVVWTGDEKRNLFDALSREGRHALPALTTAVQSKSEVEIRDYLLRLKAAETEHQMFAKHAKNVSHAEIGAAIEIDKDLELHLEDAADALAATQDFYDMSQAKGKSDELWLIDIETANSIQQRHEREQENNPEGDNELVFTSDDNKNSALAMFEFCNFLELSKNMFMNKPRRSCSAHWTAYTELDDEEPSITVEVARDFYNIAESFLQRVVQSAIFLAESRIRSTTTADYAPTRTLKDVDVVAALGVLNVPVDSWEHWKGFPRRSGLEVVLGGHGKRANQSLSLTEVEKALSVRKAKGRRRSLSSLVSMSSHDEDSEGDVHNEAVSHDKSTRSDDKSVTEHDTGEATSDAHTHSSQPESDAESDSDSSSDLDNGSAASLGSAVGHVHVSRKRRRIMMEEAEDEFMEKLDHVAQMKESTYLRECLGLAHSDEGLQTELGQRPRMSRKTWQDLHDWSDFPYRSARDRKRTADEAFRSSPEDNDLQASS